MKTVNKDFTMVSVVKRVQHRGKFRIVSTTDFVLRIRRVSKSFSSSKNGGILESTMKY